MKKTDSDFVVGIDLGTTNSAVAVVRGDAIEVIPVHGQQTMPSAVGLDPKGSLIIGQAAKNQAISAPENTVLSIKRLMGTDETVALGGRQYRPEEISSLILGELKKAAEEYLGVPVTRAVITVPAFFNERQRQATQDAGRLAGLEVLRIINEPTAAALAYGAGSTSSVTNENLLVYDLGGGTFDVSIVGVENGVVEVKASHGDTHLGGDDFDEALTQLAISRFEEIHRGNAGEISPANRRRLRAVMEKVKIRLSEDSFVPVREEYLTESAHLTTEIQRHEYEKLIEPWLQKTLDCMARALQDAGLNPSQLDKVLLVGGATRTPFVQEIIEQRLRKIPRHEINPDLIVAMGAAIQGAALAGKKAPAILIDITAHTYSTGTLSRNGFFEEYICVPIIRRGSPLPVRYSELFETVTDNQEMVNIEVFQGEGRYPDQNIKLGDFKVEGLSKVPAGNLIMIEYAIDLNGLLTVTATEKSTGLSKNITIDTGGHHRLNLDAARTNLAALFEQQDAEDPLLNREVAPEGAGDEDADNLISFDDEEFVELEASLEVEEDTDSGEAALSRKELLASAKSLRKRAEALLESGVSEADAEEIRRLLEASSAAIASSDWNALRESDERLSDLLFYLEE